MKFPDHPRIPTKPLVFDDTELLELATSCYFDADKPCTCEAETQIAVHCLCPNPDRRA